MEEKLKKKTTNKSKKSIDLDLIKVGLKNLIKDSDPFQKWLPILNDLKVQINEAKSKGISISKIRKVLKEGGLNVPPEVLKKFLGINEKK